MMKGSPPPMPSIRGRRRPAGSPGVCRAGSRARRSPPSGPASRSTRRTSCAPTRACPPGPPRRGCGACAGSPATPSPTRARPSRGRVEVAGVAAAGLLDVVGEAARVDPAAGRRRAVVPELRERVHELPHGEVVPVDLAQHVLGVRLGVGAVFGVVPGEVADRPVALALRARVVRLDALAEVMGEVELGAGVAGRVERLVTPLQEPLRVREVALLLHVRGGRHEEDLRADVLRPNLARADLRRLPPEARRLAGRPGRTPRAT
jgi:hypothetical protein